VTACMASSSESWEPYRCPHLWHSRARGGAVHSINNGLSHCKNFRCPRLAPDMIRSISPKIRNVAKIPSRRRRKEEESCYPPDYTFGFAITWTTLIADFPDQTEIFAANSTWATQSMRMELNVRDI